MCGTEGLCGNALHQYTMPARSLSRAGTGGRYRRGMSAAPVRNGLVRASAPSVVRGP